MHMSYGMFLRKELLLWDVMIAASLNFLVALFF